MPRHQLPTYSPLPAGAVLAALGTHDPRAHLAAELCATYGATEVILTDSGTSALALALRAAVARRPGLPCALPGYGCYDLATAAIAAGVRVVLYDLNPQTLAPDEASLETALARGAAALVAVHLYGVPVPMDLMRRAADGANALLIEDAAQGVGGSWAGRPLGAHGALGVLSFGRGKGMTGGGGGALLIRERHSTLDAFTGSLPEPRGTLPYLVKLVAQWALARPALYAIPAGIPALRLGETVYREPGTIEAMRAATARVLGRTRPLALSEAGTRLRNAARLIAHAGTSTVRTMAPVPGGIPGWLRLPTMVGSRVRAHAMENARLGILPGYPLPLGTLPALASHRNDSCDLPGSARLARDLWTLPTHSRLTERDLLALERWLSAARTD